MNTSERASYSRNIQFLSQREPIEMSGTIVTLARELEESPFTRPTASELTIARTHLPHSPASLSFVSQTNGEQSAARIGITDTQDNTTLFYTHDQSLDAWRVQAANTTNPGQWQSNSEMLNVLAPHLPESITPLLDINPGGDIVRDLVVHALYDRTRHLTSRVSYQQRDYTLGSIFVEQTGETQDFLSESSAQLEVKRDRENVDRVTHTLGATATFTTTEGDVRRSYRFMSEHRDEELTAIESDVTYTSDAAGIDRLAEFADHETPERLILQLGRTVELLEQLRHPSLAR